MCVADKSEECQVKKRVKIDDHLEEAGTSIANKSEKMRHLPFFLTKVRNISEKFNNSKVAVGLRGDYRLTLIVVRVWWCCTGTISSNDGGNCDGICAYGGDKCCDDKGLLLIMMIVV